MRMTQTSANANIFPGVAAPARPGPGGPRTMPHRAGAGCITHVRPKSLYFPCTRTTRNVGLAFGRSPCAKHLQVIVLGTRPAVRDARGVQQFTLRNEEVNKQPTLVIIMLHLARSTPPDRFLGCPLGVRGCMFAARAHGRAWRARHLCASRLGWKRRSAPAVLNLVRRVRGGAVDLERLCLNAVRPRTRSSVTVTPAAGPSGVMTSPSSVTGSSPQLPQRLRLEELGPCPRGPRRA